MDDELWQAIANLHREDVKLDEASVAVMRREFPQRGRGGTAFRIESGGRKIPCCGWSARSRTRWRSTRCAMSICCTGGFTSSSPTGDATTADVDALNEWVYAELFLTPSSDPWLGLAPRDVYTALEDDGRAEPAARRLAERRRLTNSLANARIPTATPDPLRRRSLRGRESSLLDRL